MNTKSQKEFDVTIIGGGPAGTATAIALLAHNPSLKVLLLEKTVYQNFRVGETLTPSIQDLFEQLGIWESFLQETHLEAFGTASVWGSPQLIENEFVFHKSGYGWHLDRRKFDQFLAQKAVEKGATLLLNSRLLDPVHFSKNQYTLIIKTDQKEIQTIRTKFVVDASGRNGLFAKGQGAQKILFDKLATAFWVFEQNPSQLLEDTYTLVEAVETGWWYSARIPNNKVVLSFMSDINLIKQLNIKKENDWKTLIAQTNYTNARVKNLEKAVAQFVQVAFSHKLDKVSGQAWIAVGDTASSFDPLSSQGIYKSIKSGIFAAYAILDYFKGVPTGLQKYERFINEEYESYLQTKIDYYRKEKRWVSSPFWKNRQAYITLNPTKKLTHNKSISTTIKATPVDLYFSKTELQSLHQICHQSQSAFEIINQYKKRNNPQLSDTTIILGIQYLCDQGVLVEA